MRKLLVGLATASLCFGIAAPAWAHVTVQPAEAPVGSFFRFVVRVPNERPDASTTKVEVQFPENLTFVSFQPKEGWERKVRMTKLEEPIEVFGEEIDEVVGSVTWSGGGIDPGEFDEFGFSARVPEEPTELEFPALQTYDSGEVVRWIGPPDAEEPAALVDVVDLGAGEGQGPLAVTAELQQRVSAMAAEQQETNSSDGIDLGVVLGTVGTALGAVALVLSLRRRT
jgi:uncharacterized protein YcnI